MKEEDECCSRAIGLGSPRVFIHRFQHSAFCIRLGGLPSRLPRDDLLDVWLVCASRRWRRAAGHRGNVRGLASRAFAHAPGRSTSLPASPTAIAAGHPSPRPPAGPSPSTGSANRGYELRGHREKQPLTGRAPSHTMSGPVAMASSATGEGRRTARPSSDAAGRAGSHFVRAYQSGESSAVEPTCRRQSPGELRMIC